MVCELTKTVQPNQRTYLGRSMIQDLCSRATTAQRQELERYDVPAQRMTDFAKGRRKPSAAQLVTICTVMGVDPVPYLVALSQQTATPAQQRLLGAFKAAAVVLVAVAELCSPSPSSAKSRGTRRPRRGR